LIIAAELGFGDPEALIATTSLSEEVSKMLYALLQKL